MRFLSFLERPGGLGLIAVLWFAFLLTIAVATANPVRLSARQIAEADYVVTGTLASADDEAVGSAQRTAFGQSRHAQHARLTGSDDEVRLTVQRQWKRRAPLGRDIRIANLAAETWQPGVRYIVPLNRGDDGRFRVIERPENPDAPATYPLTPETLGQLQRILRNR